MTLRKKNYAILVFSFFLIYFSPFILKGPETHINVHDNLDSVNLIGIFDRTFQGNFFPSNNAPELALPGVEQRYFLSEITFEKLLFYIFGYFWGYFVNEVLYRLVAFIGMLQLVKSIKRDLEFPELFQILLALSFASIPFYAQSNLSIAGLPMLFISFEKLSFNVHQIRSYMYISFYAFYSSFVLTGFFIGIIIIISYIYLILLKKLNTHLFLGALILLLSYLISHYNLFLNQIFFDVPTNRNEISPIFFAETNEAYIKFFEILYNNHYHAMTNHAIIILPTVFVLVFSDFKSSKMKKLIILILFFIFTTALIVGLSYYVSFVELIGSLGGFSWNRLYWLNPMMWYALFSIMAIELYSIYSINMKFLYSIILVSFLFGIKNFTIVDNSFLFFLLMSLSVLFIISQKYHNFRTNNRLIILTLILSQILLNTYIYTFNGFSSKPSFQEFFSREQFNEIKNTLDLNKNNIRVGCIGFYPSVANYNGFKTLGAYENIYPLTFKKTFYNIIKDEIKNNKILYNYFTKWGSRLYLFDDEIGMPYYDQQYRIKLYHPEIMCDLNIPLMKKLGTSHIFSTSKIKNADHINVKLIYISEKPNYFYKLFIYEL